MFSSDFWDEFYENGGYGPNSGYGLYVNNQQVKTDKFGRPTRNVVNDARIKEQMLNK